MILCLHLSPKKIRTYLFFWGNWNHHPKPTHISNSPLEAEEEPGEAFRAVEQAIFGGFVGWPVDLRKVD